MFFVCQLGNSGQAYKKAKILTTIPSSYKASFSYCHSFAITKNYIIFLEQPLLVNGFKLGTCTPKGKSMLDCLDWCPSEPTRFHIVDKSTGLRLKVVKFHADPFFIFHHINAYEDYGYIVMDLIAYDDPSVFYEYDLRKMRGNDWDSGTPPVAQRFVIPLVPDYSVCL